MISSQSKVKPNHQTVAAFLICAAHDANNVDVDLANKAVSIAKKNVRIIFLTLEQDYGCKTEMVRLVKEKEVPMFLRDSMYVY